MVSRKLLKDGEFNNLFGYFQNTLENLINGNKTEVRLMIEQLSKPQKVSFLEWLTFEKKNVSDDNDYCYLMSLTLHILKS